MSDEKVLAELIAIKGVGFKTASCVLLFSLGRDLFPVDTHVHRICSRLGLAPGCTTPDRTFHHMASLVPSGKGYSFHTNLIRFGRRVCRTSSPDCSHCPLFDECGYSGKRRQPHSRHGKSKVNHDFMLLDNVQ
jgi:endonuclease-3